jgi:hypothetical protein
MALARAIVQLRCQRCPYELVMDDGTVFLTTLHEGTEQFLLTEQVSFQSNVVPALQFSGKFVYTGSD